jgi:hypothetical protein
LFEVRFALQMHSALLAFNTMRDFLRGFAGSHTKFGDRIRNVHYDSKLSVNCPVAKHPVAGRNEIIKARPVACLGNMPLHKRGIPAPVVSGGWKRHPNDNSVNGGAQTESRSSDHS